MTKDSPAPVIYKDGLESARLRTRFLTQADVTPWLEYCRDPLATKFVMIPGMTPEDFSQFFINRALIRYAEGTYGLQALISKETGEMVGTCGLMVQQVSGIAEVEVGYHLLPRHWGKGYATEAAILFRDYGFEQNVAPSIVSVIDPENEASKKVARRNGMQLVRTDAELRGETVHLFRITREEWMHLRM